MKTSFYTYQIKYDMIRKKKTKGEENQYVLFTPKINWSLQKSVSSAKQEMIKPPKLHSHLHFQLCF